jgi:3-hydroxyacyl-[acyl-carrier-protein] dehydratase
MEQATEATPAAAVTDADIDLIQRILPHRYPFLLVDRVRNIEGWNRAQGIKNVTINEPHFTGHFPSEPIMPGVLIVEAMAQTAGVMIGVGVGGVDTGAIIYFMAIDNCKFRRKVVPGDQLLMDLETLRGRPGGKVWRLRGTATVDGELAAEAEFTAMVEFKGA